MPSLLEEAIDLLSSELFWAAAWLELWESIEPDSNSLCCKLAALYFSYANGSYLFLVVAAAFALVAELFYAKPAPPVWADCLLRGRDWFCCVIPDSLNPLWLRGLLRPRLLSALTKLCFDVDSFIVLFKFYDEESRRS